MAKQEFHPGLAQAMDPAAQQRRGLELARIDATAGRHERFHPQIRRPFPQRVGIEFREERRPHFWGLSCASVARDEVFARLGVGEIQASATGDEKLAAHGWLGIEQRHGRAARRRHFRGAQTRRTAADDRKVDAGGKQSRARRATPIAPNLGASESNSLMVQFNAYW